MQIRDVNYLGVVDTKIVIIPVGSTEQHGPHLPLGTDTIIASELANRVAEKIDAYVAPTIPFGMSEHHMDFCGTVSIRGDVLAEYLLDVFTSFARHGFKIMVVMNGHGGNEASIKLAIQKFQRGHDAQIVLLLFNWWMLEDIYFEDVNKDFHAGDAETSVMLALGLQLCGEPIDEMYDFKEGEVLAKTRDISRSGVVGYPTRATVAKGRKIIELAVNRMCDTIRNILERSK